MAKEEKIIYVYDDFTGDEPVLLGKLNVGVIKGGESYSFEYDKDWLAKNKLQLNLDPELLPFAGRQFPVGKNIFGIFADASPDRWGRMLMNKRERLLAGREKRKPSNTDDHLRNYAFVLTAKGWILSPLYDVNPVPYGDELSLLVDDEDNSISIELAVQTAPRFGISKKDALVYAEDILSVVRDNWEKLAKEYGLPRGQVEDMRPAFDICYR